MKPAPIWKPWKPTTVDYFLGAGPHAATRVEYEKASTVEIRMFNGKIVGHGNTAKEAATHLAEQLRALAHLVEVHEGIRGNNGREW